MIENVMLSGIQFVKSNLKKAATEHDGKQIGKTETCLSQSLEKLGKLKKPSCTCHVLASGLVCFAVLHNYWP